MSSENRFPGEQEGRVALVTGGSIGIGTGTIQELGALISFVTSPRASFMTGDDIRVDGGLLARLAVAAPKGEN